MKISKGSVILERSIYGSEERCAISPLRYYGEVSDIDYENKIYYCTLISGETPEQYSENILEYWLEKNNEYFLIVPRHIYVLMKKLGKLSDET